MCGTVYAVPTYSNIVFEKCDKATWGNVYQQLVCNQTREESLLFIPYRDSCLKWLNNLNVRPKLEIVRLKQQKAPDKTAYE